MNIVKLPEVIVLLFICLQLYFYSRGSMLGIQPPVTVIVVVTRFNQAWTRGDFKSKEQDVCQPNPLSSVAPEHTQSRWCLEEEDWSWEKCCDSSTMC